MATRIGGRPPALAAGHRLPRRARPAVCRGPPAARAAPRPDDDDAGFPSFKFNPFKDKKKEVGVWERESVAGDGDSTRCRRRRPTPSPPLQADTKAMLQSMFQDKGDPLSMYDGDGPQLPGARKKEKEAPPPFDPKAALGAFIAGLGSRARGFLRALAALAMFAGVFVAVPMAGPAARAGVAAVNWCLRLDAATPRARAAKRTAARLEALKGSEASAGLGEHELRAVARFGPP